MTSKTKTSLETELSDMLTGFQSDLPSTVKSVVLTGKLLTPAQVEQLLQSYITPCAAVATAKASYSQAVAARKTVEPAAMAALKGLRTFLQQLFPGDAATLAKFGVTYKAPTTPSTAAKAAAAAKRKATRASKKPAAAAPAPSAAVSVESEGSPLGSASAAAVNATATPPTGGSGASTK